MTWSQNNNGAICKPGNCSSSMLAFLTLLTDYLGHSYDDKFTNPDDDTDEFDFIVVGGGGAGCVVANRLSENPNWKILLLEEGDEEPIVADVPGLFPFLKKSSIDYYYLSQPEPRACAKKPNNSCDCSSGKTMGGSSVTGSFAQVRGNKRDYDNWANLGNIGWSWEEVLPYFKKSENMMSPEVLTMSPLAHGVGGYQTIQHAQYFDGNAKILMDGWKELGLQEVDYNSGDNIGTSRVQYSSVEGSRESINGAFIRPIRGKRSNLIIRPNSRVTKIIIDSETKKAKGVEYESNKLGTTKKGYAAKEVILSAGTFISPKLLMLSGIGPSDDLKQLGIEVIQNLPVGRNLQNHIGINPTTVQVTNKNTLFSLDTLQNDLTYWLSSREGPMAYNGFMDSITFLSTPYETIPNLPDIEVDFSKFVYDPSTKSQLKRFPYYDGFTYRVIHLAPKGRGILKLNSSDPAGGQPMIQLNYYSHPDDIKAIAEGVRITNRLLSTQAFMKGGFVGSRTPAPDCDNLVYDTDEYYACLAKTNVEIMHHYAGTCKMGPKGDIQSVVDPRLRVYGIQGLRVIDASIIPTLMRGNSQAGTVMIAEKGSDMIKEDWVNKEQSLTNVLL